MRKVLGQGDGSPAPQVLHHDHRMHVGLPTYSRGVAKLGSNEANGCHDILLPLALALSLPQIREHRRRPQRSTPGSEILRRVRDLRDGLDGVVDVARIHVLPLSVLEVSEQPWSRGLQQLGYEFREILA